MNQRLLLALLGLSALFVLFAFTAPETIRGHVWTLLLPEGERPIAKVHAPSARTERLAPQVRMERDTNPPLKDRTGDFLTGNKNPVDLKDPKVIEKQVEYDPITNRYIVTEKIGDDFYRAPTYMTFEEYVRWRDQKQQREYFDRLQGVRRLTG